MVDETGIPIGMVSEGDLIGPRRTRSRGSPRLVVDLARGRRDAQRRFSRKPVRTGAARPRCDDGTGGGGWAETELREVARLLTAHRILQSSGRSSREACKEVGRDENGAAAAHARCKVCVKAELRWVVLRVWKKPARPELKTISMRSGLKSASSNNFVPSPHTTTNRPKFLAAIHLAAISSGSIARLE